MRAEQRGKSEGEFEGENVRRCERRESGKVKSWGGGGRVRNGAGEEV